MSQSQSLSRLPSSPSKGDSTIALQHPSNRLRVDDNNPLKFASSQEKIQPVELEALISVFQYLSHTDAASYRNGVITSTSIQNALNHLNFPMTKKEIDLMLWEADENSNGTVEWLEFLTIFQRNINDKTGFEPKQLYLLTLFLMYDEKKLGKISIENTLRFLYVRYGRENLDHEIYMIFGSEDTAVTDGIEMTITYSQFLERMEDRVRKQRNKKKTIGAKKRDA